MGANRFVRPESQTGPRRASAMPGHRASAATTPGEKFAPSEAAVTEALLMCCGPLLVGAAPRHGTAPSEMAFEDGEMSQYQGPLVLV
jgi:hypothetical protein